MQRRAWARRDAAHKRSPRRTPPHVRGARRTVSGRSGRWRARAPRRRAGTLPAAPPRAAAGACRVPRGRSADRRRRAPVPSRRGSRARPVGRSSRRRRDDGGRSRGGRQARVSVARRRESSRAPRGCCRCGRRRGRSRAAAASSRALRRPPRRARGAPARGARSSPRSPTPPAAWARSSAVLDEGDESSLEIARSHVTSSAIAFPAEPNATASSACSRSQAAAFPISAGSGATTSPVARSRTTSSGPPASVA